MITFSTDREAKLLDVVPLVQWLAGRMRRPRAIETEDLIQEGLLAILKYMDNHDPSRGEFSGFASTVARRAMDRYVDQYRSIIRVPAYTRPGRADDVERARQVENSISHMRTDDMVGIPDPAPAAEDVAFHRELLERARRLLTDREFRMFELWLEGRTYPEIGREFGVGPFPAWKAKEKAVRRLRSAVRDAGRDASIS